MANRYNRLSTKPGFVYHSNKGEPPDKKRRTESNAPKPAADLGDDLWDDDLDFTQDQLANIDQVITMSQQVAPDPSTHRQSSSSSRMVGRGTGRSQSASDVLSGSNQNDRKAAPTSGTSFTKTGAQRGARVPSSTVTSGTKPSVPFKYSSSTTSKPVGSTLRDQPASSRPVSQSNWTGGLPGTKGQLTPITGTTGSDQMSPALPAQAKTDFADVTQQLVAKLQKDLTSAQEENKQLKNFRCQKEGEVQMLRRELQGKREELTKLRNDESSARDQHRIEQVEKEKELVKEVDKLRIQIQFTERERDELKTRCKVLEKRNSLSSGSNDAQSSPLLSTQQSPRRKTKLDGRSPKNSKGNFPNRDSFMADEAASTRSPRKKLVAEASTVTDGPTQARDPDWQKKFTVETRYQRGRISGPTLVSLMLPKSTGNVTSGQGIVGILQTQQNKGDPQKQPVAKDQDGSISATQMSRWVQNLHQQPLAKDIDQLETQIVPDEHYALAVQAVKNLLETDSDIPVTGLLDNHTEHAIYLLPVIESYLTHYLDLVRTMQPTSSVSSSVNSLSSPLDSYDSVSSYQRSMAEQNASYVSQVEQWALNALHVLHVLVEFSPHVRLALFGATTREHGQEPRKLNNNDGQISLQDQESTDEGSSDESLGNSHSSLTASKISAAAIARKCEILERLIRTANPVLPNEKFGSTNIIEVSLQILSLLASHISTNRLQRFEPLLSQDILLSCLDDELEGPPEQRLRRHMEVLNLVQSLTRCVDILPKLCCASGDCLLSTFYALASSPPHGASEDYRIRFGLKLVQLLSSAISHHPSGMSTLLDYECICSCEVVKTVTQLLHHGLLTHRAAPSALSSSLLHQGAVLLCALAQSSRHFHKQRREIENLYIEVVIGLHVVAKEAQDNRHHNDVVQTLWDFDVEYGQYSDDSENAMDTT